jgi:3-deoxy-D-manno-octulosonic-acid transferase
MFIYRFILASYQLALKIASPFHPKAAKMLQGRENVFEELAQTLPQKLSQNPQNSPQHITWFHCASLGEFEQSRPLIESFKAEYPQIKIILTFFSPSGYEIRKNYQYASYVCYLPFDSETHAKQWFDMVKPNLIFFVKYEFWHYYLAEAQKRNIPTISFSAIFRKEQLFFKPYGSFYRNMLKNFTHIFVQNQESLDLLQQIAITQTSVAGDTRFDRVWEIAKQAQKFASIETFKQNEICLVIGSAWADDMAVIAPILNNFEPALKIIIAPHEITEKNITTLLQKFSHKKIIRYTQIAQFSETEIQNANILVIDTIGILSALYRYADIAFVGGGYGDGLHNILEPAVFALPILFGNKKHKKFQEALDLLSLGGAMGIPNSQTFEQVFTMLYQNVRIRKEKGEICYQYVQKNLGGTNKILNFLRSNVEIHL